MVWRVFNSLSKDDQGALESLAIAFSKATVSGGMGGRSPEEDGPAMELAGGPSILARKVQELKTGLRLGAPDEPGFFGKGEG